MNADQLKTLTNDALDRLGALLDAGHSEQLTLLLRAIARFRRYSSHNVCLIASQYPTATHVAGFHAWRTLGRFVRKGEKGIAILAPIVGEAIGLQVGDAARDYIHLYRGDRDGLLASLDRVRAAATTIVSSFKATRPAVDSAA
jgi:hypothetical protein